MPSADRFLWLPTGTRCPGRDDDRQRQHHHPNPRRNLYHAYLQFITAMGYQHVMNLTAFDQAVPRR
ncbi:winged helix-turn-helix domain-containing protein [Serratia marcescens]|nr:winged helix-turn-helix domain-containing protein [Serratia marcescens]